MAKGATYLFLGPEIGERADAVEDLRSRLAKTAGGPAEEYSFYAGEVRLGEVVSQLQNGSLFSDARLFIVKNADLLKKKEDIDILLSYLNNPSDDTVLILTSDETSLDRRIEGALSKDAKKVFWELFENRKTEWVTSFFRREGFRIDADGVETILELVENNTDALRRECSRLALFLDKEKVITAEAVEACLSHSREESAFTLFSRIAEGDLERSLETVRALLAAKESPVAILAGLSWCFHRLADYQRLAGSGKLNDFELKKAGLASKKAQKDYQAAARRYTPEAARCCIALIAEGDAALRASGSLLEELMMDLFITKLLEGGKTRLFSRVLAGD